MAPHYNNLPDWYEPEPRKDWIYLVLIFATGAAFWLGLHLGGNDLYSHYEQALQTITKPDTVFVDRIKTDTVMRIAYKDRYLPRKVTVYLPDTARRQRLERDNLVTGLVLGPGALRIETITPRGLAMDQDYRLPPPAYLQLTMDAAGALAIGIDSVALRRDQRRARWRKVGNWCLVGAGVVVGVLVGQGKDS